MGIPVDLCWKQSRISCSMVERHAQNNGMRSTVTATVVHWAFSQNLARTFTVVQSGMYNSTAALHHIRYNYVHARFTVNTVRYRIPSTCTINWNLEGSNRARGYGMVRLDYLPVWILHVWWCIEACGVSWVNDSTGPFSKTEPVFCGSIEFSLDTTR